MKKRIQNKTGTKPVKSTAKPDKLVVTVPASKPRNPVARSPLLRKGGVHQKSEQALRKQAKDVLLKSLGDTPEDGT